MKESDIVKSLVELYIDRLGSGAEMTVTPLPRAGGDRRYFRLTSPAGSCIGSYAPDTAEGKCFVDLARALGAADASVPRILASADDPRFYLQEDLGDRSLFSMLGDEEATSLVKATLRRLVALQKAPEDSWESHCISAPFSPRQVMWDLNYFKYEYLKQSDFIFDEERLEDDFELLAYDLCAVKKEFTGFMMRDCQSRNVMVTSRGPVFIDFQGGRRGPALYDAVSLLWQARAGFSPSFREEMMDYYSDLFCGGDQSMKREMLALLPLMVLFRTLQVLGAYGFRGLVQHRAHFIVSIPRALDNLRELIAKGAVNRYPELKRAAQALVADSRFVKDVKSDSASAPCLTVEVFSFSYKKGYPADFSGNGGGFMFDCRAMHNPGRYAEYRQLTGRDRPVIDFLEKRGEVQKFLSAAWSLTDPAVERYLRRGFSNLQIGFGCTGGQHRSVYCAEATARHIEALFPDATVSLLHREHP